MIITDLKSAFNYYNLSPYMEKAFEFIANSNLAELPTGKYDIDAENIFAMVNEYQTKNIAEAKWEAHIKYLDIQYLIQGEEKIGYIDIKECKEVEAYNTQRDIYFLEALQQANYPLVKQEQCAIILPKYAHMPCLSVHEGIYHKNKKIVVKVKMPHNILNS